MRYAICVFYCWDDKIPPRRMVLYVVIINSVLLYSCDHNCCGFLSLFIIGRWFIKEKCTKLCFVNSTFFNMLTLMQHSCFAFLLCAIWLWFYIVRYCGWFSYYNFFIKSVQQAVVCGFYDRFSWHLFVFGILSVRCVRSIPSIQSCEDREI